MKWPEQDIEKDVAVAALQAVESEGLVHRMGRFTGADCPIEEALADVEKSTGCYWTTNLFRHDLVVVVDGVPWFYSAERPERTMPRITIRVQLGDGPVMCTTEVVVEDPAAMVEEKEHDLADVWDWTELADELRTEIETKAGWGLVLAARKRRARETSA